MEIAQRAPSAEVDGVDPERGDEARPRRDAPASGEEAPPPIWAPFRHIAFTVLWTAALASNIGAWMHEISAGWLMTELAPSPIMVALVQGAATLPVFLLALPAGALADIVDRRRMLLIVFFAVALSTLALALLTAGGRMTPGLLILFTLATGVAAAFSSPTWHALIPQLTPRRELSAAIVLNSVGANIARTVGPAIGGVLIAVYGPATPFFLNAVAFMAVVAALLWWRPAPPPKAGPPEHVGGAIRAGLRYAVASRPLHDTLIRAVAFFAFASAYWALLPLIARQGMEAGPEFYGLLQASIGLGAVLSALLLPQLKARLSPDRLVTYASATMVGVLLVFAGAHNPVVCLVASLLAGGSWLVVLSSLSVSAQLALPEWVRARGLAIFLMIFYGALTLGGVLWGALAEEIGIPNALFVAAAGAAVMTFIGERWRLGQGAALDLSPSMHWAKPVVRTEVEPDRGPVLITVRYKVPAANRLRFLAEIPELKLERMRNGAFSWGIYEDVACPGWFIETFSEASWIEHLRHHERVTQSDRALQDRIAGLVERQEVAHHVAPAGTR